MKVVKQIDVYLVRKRNTRPIEVVQIDTGIQLVFTVKDFEIPTGTTATLYVQKPSGKFVYQEDEITVDGNKIIVDLENQAIVEHGKVPYQVSLENGTDTITTFEGLMLVDRSLKDSGATESKTVIRAFDNVVQNRLNEFQTRAEQVAQDVIATIPEDYTVMTAKVNQLANAIKGHLSGAVVVADDVSPVEHIPEVWVHGKNLFDISKLSNIDGKLTNNNDGTLTISANQYAVPTGKKLNELCPSLKAGNVYTLSFVSTSVNTRYIWLNGANVMLYNSTYTFTDEMLNSELYLYGFRDTDDSYGNACTISNIQIEEGNTATEYTPYIDPATVNVRRCGKNLLPNAATNESYNGITITVNEDKTLVVNGTATDPIFYAPYEFTFRAGVEYILSGCPADGSADTYFVYINNLGGVRDYGEGVSVLLDEDFTSAVGFCVRSGTAIKNLTFKPMVRLAKIKDESFEKHVGTTHIPSSDGTVEGMTSLSPNMTILTDTEGMIVECEYNKDTNKVIQKLADALGVTI